MHNIENKFLLATVGLVVTLFTILETSVFAQVQSPCAGTVTITDTSQVQPGILLVLTNTRTASFTVSGPKTYKGSGGMLAEQNIPPGTYAVTWDPIVGCEAPPPETKSTDAKGSVAFAGNYKDLNPKGSGNITISPNPRLFHIDYTFTIQGPEGIKTVNTKGSEYHWFSAPSGVYTISFGPVAGFETPAPVTQTLAPKGAVTFSGEYRAKKDVLLKVTSEPTGANVYVNEGFVGRAPATKILLRNTDYKVRCTLSGYKDVVIDSQLTSEEGIPVDQITEKCWLSGVPVPSPQPGSIEAPRASSQQGVGTIVVQIEPPIEADIHIIGSENQTLFRATVSTWKQSAPVGIYTVTYGKAVIGGYSVPPPETKTLKEGETLIFEGVYRKEGVTEKATTQTEKPQGFFKKAQNAISSFFSKMFSIFKRRPSQTSTVTRPVTILSDERELQGRWKIEKFYFSDPDRLPSKRVLEKSVKSPYNACTSKVLDRPTPSIETSSFERIAPRGREAAALRKIPRRFAAKLFGGENSKWADLSQLRSEWKMFIIAANACGLHPRFASMAHAGILNLKRVPG